MEKEILDGVDFREKIDSMSCKEYEQWSSEPHWAESAHFVLNKSTWKPKDWNGLVAGDQVVSGIDIWSDGVDIYYSNGNEQYVLDKSTSTWKDKEWFGIDFDVYGELEEPGLCGRCIWSDGVDIYYSHLSYQYILDRSASTWKPMIWKGLTSFLRECIWTDNINIYYSNFSIFGDRDQYVLDKSTSTWKRINWNGIFQPRYGGHVWCDIVLHYMYKVPLENCPIYYSCSHDQYVLDRASNTWNPIEWKCRTSLSGRFINQKLFGQYIWSDFENIYYSNGSDQYVLDRPTSTWVKKRWNGLKQLNKNVIWNDGKQIYASYMTDDFNFTLFD